MLSHTDTQSVPWLNDLVSHCQLLAGQVSDVPPPALILAVRGLVARIPPRVSAPERTVVRDILGQLLARIATLNHVDRHPAVEHAFLVFAASRSTAEGWRLDLSELADRFATALQEAGLDDPPGCHVVDPRVDRALRVIQLRHQESELTLREVAKAANLSPWHLARMLKRDTGVGFVAHIRRSRVAETERLLAQTVLSVKEIAAAVGYRNPRQLDRDFKRICGVTPLEFRRNPSVVRSPNQVERHSSAVEAPARKDFR
jgi:AraC-like DNA-binding protein